jgi:hypothetical protein
MNNEFVDIKGFEGFYSINRKGEILSHYQNKIIKVSINRKGYYRIGLRKQGTRKYFTVHRLVALTFINNPDNKPEVNHIDCNKLNNNVENLEWVYPSENMQHAKRHGLVNTREQQNKIRESCGYINMIQADMVRELYKTGKYTQLQIGKAFYVSEAIIYHVINNHTYKEAI